MYIGACLYLYTKNSGVEGYNNMKNLVENATANSRWQKKRISELEGRSREIIQFGNRKKRVRKNEQC